MKNRTGFVSNSSSSSFIINKSQMTSDEIEAIRDPKKYFEVLFDSNPQHLWTDECCDEPVSNWRQSEKFFFAKPWKSFDWGMLEGLWFEQKVGRNVQGHEQLNSAQLGWPGSAKEDWVLSFEEDKISGDTCIDNFNYVEFLHFLGHTEFKHEGDN